MARRGAQGRVGRFLGDVLDESVTPPAQISLTRISVSGENLSNAAKLKGRATLQITVNKRGALSLSGPLTIAPFAASLNVMTRNIDLVPFQPYVTRAARVILTGGAASAKGTLDFATGTTPRGGFKGDLVLDTVATLDEANETDLARWHSLALGGIDAQFEPLAVNVGDIALDDFFARLILNENGEFNLQQLARAGSRPWRLRCDRRAAHR